MGRRRRGPCARRVRGPRPAGDDPGAGAALALSRRPQRRTGGPALGRASVRPSPTRFVWPAIAACMTAIALGLGGWAGKERTGRLELARLMQQPTPVGPAPTEVQEPSPEPPPAGSYFAMSRLVRQDP